MHRSSRSHSHPQLGLFSTIGRRRCAAALLALGVACGKVPEPEAKPAEPAPAALKQDKPAEPAPAEPAPPAAAPAAPPAEEPPEFPKEGWSKLSMRETLPFCVFSDMRAREAALHIEQVKKQTLKADQPVVFGVYGPWCLNKECDALPMIECWVDKEGEDTLVLHSHFFSFHKDGVPGGTCKKDCLAIDAMCSSPDLKPGRYTVKHGDKTYPLHIPSVVKDPCLNKP